jgi:hypothetical protein
LSDNTSRLSRGTKDFVGLQNSTDLKAMSGGSKLKVQIEMRRRTPFESSRHGHDTDAKDGLPEGFTFLQSMVG